MRFIVARDFQQAGCGEVVKVFGCLLGAGVAHRGYEGRLDIVDRQSAQIAVGPGGGPVQSGVGGVDVVAHDRSWAVGWGGGQCSGEAGQGPLWVEGELGGGQRQGGGQPGGELDQLFGRLGLGADAVFACPGCQVSAGRSRRERAERVEMGSVGFQLGERAPTGDQDQVTVMRRADRPVWCPRARRCPGARR